MLLQGKRGKEFIPFCMNFCECKWMESMYEFANELYVERKDWVSAFICSFFDLAKLPTETKFNHLE